LPSITGLQPHESSSETHPVLPQSSMCCRLQPHESSSETDCQPPRLLRPARFNLTRVRLKPLTYHQIPISGASFNLTRVRLKPLMTMPSYPGGMMLQPHESSSETLVVGFRWVSVDRFNLTRVRLKPYCRHRTRQPWTASTSREFV